MPKLKEVLSTEVHWQMVDWQIKDQANIRIKQLMGDNARYFAPVYVTHASYYWSDAEPHLWSLLTDADERDKADVQALIAQLHQTALSRYPTQHQRIENIFAVPNSDYIYYRRLPEGGVDVRLTGWGFANYHRAYGGPIREVPTEDNLRQVKVCFSIDGIRVPGREFEFFRSTMWVGEVTDADGYFDFGRLGPGTELQLRDVKTGLEKLVKVDADTSVIDIDVTEYLTVRITGRFDGAPLSDENCSVVYGHRSNDIRLSNGVAECRLPWLEGVDCTVTLRGESMCRALDKEQVNVFNFEFNTPEVAKTKVRVTVSGDGLPLSDEVVKVSAGGSERIIRTDVNGVAETEFETPEQPVQCTAQVRDAISSEQLGNETVLFDFRFDTPVREEFDASLLVVDQLNNAVAHYPVIVKINGEENSYLSDDDGRVALGRVCSGDIMTVSDGHSMSMPRQYELNYRQPEYVYMLPYAPEEGDGAYTLRVIEIDGRPSAGTLCILNQDGRGQLAHLDERGEMRFDSDSFVIDKDIQVSLYSSRRTFPKMSFRLEKDEFEYELKEVSGPTPWWKVLLEILALAGLGLSFIIMMPWWYEIFRDLPLFFA